MRVGWCQVKIASKTSANCGSVPVGVWYDDKDYGGPNKEITLGVCKARGWGGYCGTTAEYRLKPASNTTATVRFFPCYMGTCPGGTITAGSRYPYYNWSGNHQVTITAPSLHHHCTIAAYITTFICREC